MPAELSLWRQLARGLTTMGLVLLAGLSLAGSLGPFAWQLELTRHFRCQYLLAQLCLLPLLWIVFDRRHSADDAKPSKTRLWVAALLVTASPNLLAVLPYWLPQPQPMGNARLKLLHLNLYAENRQYAQVAELVQRYQPDIVDFVEYTEEARNQLEGTGILSAYPYRVSGRAHLGLYSKLPLSEARLLYLSETHTANFAEIRARVSLAGKAVNLLIAHPQLPFGGNLLLQTQRFDDWVSQRASLGSELILVGDLNTSPWSANFAKLTAAQLRDSQLGQGLQPSWPVFMPSLHFNRPSPLLWPLRIPIDHVLISPGLAVWRRELGPFVGSDHLPVYIEIGFRNV